MFYTAIGVALKSVQHTRVWGKSPLAPINKAKKYHEALYTI
jgi:hypothetical protein